MLASIALTITMSLWTSCDTTTPDIAIILKNYQNVRVQYCRATRVQLYTYGGSTSGNIYFRKYTYSTRTRTRTCTAVRVHVRLRRYFRTFVHHYLFPEVQLLPYSVHVHVALFRPVVIRAYLLEPFERSLWHAPDTPAASLSTVTDRAF
mgnify:CR=1 FL=1